MTLAELLIGTGVLLTVLAVTMQSIGLLIQVTTRESQESQTMSSARGAVELAIRMLRDEFVVFNSLPGTPLGVDFTLGPPAAPVVLDGVLFYVDTNHSAAIFKGSTSGQPQTAGLDDFDGDGSADVVGLALVRQDLDADGAQDFLDVDADRRPDDIDGDGNADLLWTLTMARFGRIADASDPQAWFRALVLAPNVYVQRLNPRGPLTGANITVFQFAATNSLAMSADSLAAGGNGDGKVDEQELGSIATADGLINHANEVASIDSIVVTVTVARMAREGLGRTSIQRGDVFSALVSPRALTLIRRNGLVGVPDATNAANID